MTKYEKIECDMFRVLCYSVPQICKSRFVRQFVALVSKDPGKCAVAERERERERGRERERERERDTGETKENGAQQVKLQVDKQAHKEKMATKVAVRDCLQPPRLGQ